MRARLEGGLGETLGWVRCLGERGGVKEKGRVEEGVEGGGGGVISVRSMKVGVLVVSGGGEVEEGGKGLEGGEERLEGEL